MINDFVRIIVILPNNFGDIIMATPVLEGLKKKYPDSHITFFAETGFEGGLINNPFIDKIYPFDRKLLKRLFKKGAWRSGSQKFISIINELNNHHYDLLINLSQHSYTSNLAPLIYAKSVFGCHFLREGNDAITDAWTQYLYAIPFARRYNSFHAVDVYRRIANALYHHGGYTIAITDSEKKVAGKYLAGKGIDISPGRIIIFQPGAAFASKRWPAENFIKLGRLLTQKGWQVVISGAPSEKELAMSIQKEIGEDSFTTAGDTNFRQAIANLSFAQGCVTGDTALMHAAAALNVKTYALFSTTSPVETGPYGNGHYVFSGDCTKKPCFCDQCKSMLCMKSILPETLFSCIENGTLPSKPGCDIYKTSLKENGDYSIIPVVPNAFAYFNTAGAAITKNIFEKEPSWESLSQEELDKCFEESKQFIAVVTKMEDLLLDFMHNRNAESIRAFEKQKDTLSQLSSIAEFWAAILNLRLNSIPILNPVEALRLSAQACSITKEQIKAVLAL